MNADNNNQGNVNSSQNTQPYRASGNLNTTIGNPHVNINDTMNVNIKTMPSSNVSQEVNKSYQAEVINNPSANGPVLSNNTPAETKTYPNNNLNTSQNVTRTYVTNDNRPKKRAITFNIGPEFKLVLLIIVILLIFIFILPMIANIF